MAEELVPLIAFIRAQGESPIHFHVVNNGLREKHEFLKFLRWKASPMEVEVGGERHQAVILIDHHFPADRKKAGTTLMVSIDHERIPESIPKVGTPISSTRKIEDEYQRRIIARTSIHSDGERTSLSLPWPELYLFQPELNLNRKKMKAIEEFLHTLVPRFQLSNEPLPSMGYLHHPALYEEMLSAHRSAQENWKEVEKKWEAARQELIDRYQPKPKKGFAASLKAIKSAPRNLIAAVGRKIASRRQRRIGK